MHIVLFCATRRGHRFLERLLKLAKGAEISVVSFREESWEPPYFEDIRRLAERSGSRFLEAKTIDGEIWERWNTRETDLVFAVSWRYMIPDSIYRKVEKGAYVFHDSLLPRYRGFSPTVWSILNGEAQTGVTLIEMVDKVDAGDIVDQERVPIGPDDRISGVVERVTEAYLLLLERNLGSLMRGDAPRRPQDHELATYTCRLLPGDCCIDWKRSTQDIYNLIRAYSSPYPGAYTYLSGQLMKVWDAKLYHKADRYVGRIPGRVTEIYEGDGVVVLTGDGGLLLRQVQLDGKDVVSAEKLLKRLSMTLG